MTWRIPLTKSRYATLISAYAPTLNDTELIKDEFYESLDTAIRTVPFADKLILLGDFNARVGKDHQLWPGVIGRHGIGSMNSNGLRLLSLCSEHSLNITNTTFQLKNKYKVSWMHPRSKHWHLLDYIIIRQRDNQDITLTRAMRGAECSTDHNLIVGNLILAIRPAARRIPAQNKLNCDKLKDVSVRNEFRMKLADAFIDPQPTNINNQAGLDEEWSFIKTQLYKCAETTLGFTKNKHKDWFDENAENIHDLLKAKNKAHNNWLSNPTSIAAKNTFQDLKRESQRLLREIENSWWIEQAKQLQHFADTNDQQGFYNGIKTIFGPKNSNITPVRSLDGVLIKEREEILNRWSQHFNRLLNQRNPVDANIIDEIDDMPPAADLDIPPTFAETKKAIQSLKNGKSPGPDNLPGELFKEGGYLLHRRIHDLILAVWRTGKTPSEFQTSDMITIYKRKGDRSLCENSRGISLLVVASKILAKIMLARLVDHLSEQILPESQCGFRKERSTGDMLFVLRQLQEKAIEQRRDLYIAFIDLAKAFDTVSRETLWLALSKFGVPPAFLNILKSLHENTTAAIRSGSSRSSSFPIEVGVKQGCVLAPVIFNLYLTAVTMLCHRTMSPSEGVSIEYRLDGSLFNIRRLQARTKTSLAKILELQYADDCAIIAHTPEDLQASLTNVTRIYTALGLKININKTEIVAQRGVIEEPITFQLNEEEIKQVDTFNYLGGIVTENNSLDKEICFRINKASVSFGKLRPRVFENNNLKLKTKISVYSAVCLSSLLYGSESWTTYRRHVKQLEAFHIQCLQRIIGVTWRDKIPHTDILLRTNSKSIEAMIANKHLRWTGHVIRMPEHRLPRQVLYGQLEAAPRTAGGPKKRFKDNLKATLKKCNMNPLDIELIAQNRPQWRSMCKEGIQQLENARIQAKTAQRQRRNLNPHHENDAVFPCLLCGKNCKSRIGLNSHTRWHQRQEH